ncbi:MAG TPA: DUF3857 domain-containing protein [Flavisolibacter sp.]|nr:DUF3857 domain-containing protein [Flavisolibacter sp.]
MKRIICLSCLLLLMIAAGAEEPKYPVSAIPFNLIKNAYVVKRLDETEFRIISTDETVLKRKYALTVLNENGDPYATFVEYYDKLQQVRSIEGALYDAAGRLVKKLKGKDILDLSAVDDNNLIDDSRRKQHDFYYRNYPYTVEYEVEIKANNTMFFPVWVPQEAEYMSIEQSAHTIICDAAYEVRYRAFNYKGEPAVTSEKGKKFMRWEVRNLASVQRPFASPSWRELTTMVYFAPTDFEIQGYKGSMKSWEEFGRFQAALNSKRDQLPEKIVQAVRQLTSGVNDDIEKARILYQYLQKNTRYISIQLGIGGWQPFEAATVAEKGYGDCKALSNYMHSLLKAAGIKSHYALIYAGQGEEQRMIEDFPSRQFNHAILCVPAKQDTLWLECTSQSAPAGYMGDFTGNRKALLIAEDGGKLVSTPRYGLRENLLVRKIRARVETDGTLNMKVQTRYGGTQQDDRAALVNQLSKEKVKKFLQQELELSTYEVNGFSYQESKGLLPELSEELDITVSGYATISGKRLFIMPNTMNRNGRRLEMDKDRTVDFVFSAEYRDEDIYEFELPEGYELESKPQDVVIKTRYGNYTASVKIEGNKIIYSRLMEKFAGRFPAAEQEAIIRFYADIYKADRSKVVMVKKS